METHPALKSKSNSTTKVLAFLLATTYSVITFSSPDAQHHLILYYTTVTTKYRDHSFPNLNY